MPADQGTPLLAPRQKRIENADPLLYAVIESVQYALRNYSRHGLALGVPSSFVPPKGNFLIALHYDDKQIYQGQAA